MQRIEWKDVVGYEGLYQVSNRGKVRKCSTKEFIKMHECEYLFCNLTRNKQTRSKRIHRLVAEAFIPNPENKPTVNHKDGDKYNNNVDNLEWATYSENNQHALDTGLNDHDRFKKMSDEEAIQAVITYRTTQATYEELAEKYDVTYQTILNLNNGHSREYILEDDRIPEETVFKGAANDEQVIKYIRKYRNGECTQTKAAEILGIASNTFSMINSGKRRPYLQDMI